MAINTKKVQVNVIKDVLIVKYMVNSQSKINLQRLIVKPAIVTVDEIQTL